MSKVVLITGGSSGIGKSIGEFLHQKGFVVYGISRNPEKITNSIFPLVALDVRDKQSIVNCVAEVIQKSGRLDIVINNAGIVVGKYFHEHTHDQIQKSMVINSNAFMHIALEFLPEMMGENSGAICNIASSAGLISNPKMSVYAASKWAVVGWSDSLRLEMEQR